MTSKPFSSLLGSGRFLQLLMFLAACRIVELKAAEPPSRYDLWQRLEKFTQPPSDFAGQFGSYRSPLEFADGTKARSTDDWTRRRTEILETWYRRLGPWPPLVERPAVKRLETVQQD